MRRIMETIGWQAVTLPADGFRQTGLKPHNDRFNGH